mgnify:CR=1 FL=1
MKRLPLVPTLVVVSAVAVMIGLGVWQLQRASWKTHLLDRYHANATLPAVAFPAVPVADDALLYRHAQGYCLQIVGWAARSGHNRAGDSGWRHVAQCRTGAEGPGMAVDFGWSRSGDSPRAGRLGPVSGMIAPDRTHVFLLVSDQPASGLQPSASPSPEEIPNNHLSYAVQWFLFAGIAVLIYLLALRQTLAGTGRPG